MNILKQIAAANEEDLVEITRKLMLYRGTVSRQVAEAINDRRAELNKNGETQMNILDEIKECNNLGELHELFRAFVCNLESDHVPAVLYQTYEDKCCDLRYFADIKETEESLRRG